MFNFDNLNQVDLSLEFTEDNVLDTNNEVKGDDSYKQRLMNFLNYLREFKSIYPSLVFVFEGTEHEKM